MSDELSKMFESYVEDRVPVSIYVDLQDLAQYLAKRYANSQVDGLMDTALYVMGYLDATEPEKLRAVIDDVLEGGIPDRPE